MFRFQVLIQTVVDVILSLPFFIYYTYTSYTTFTDPFQVALYQLILTVTNIAYYLTFAVNKFNSLFLNEKCSILYRILYLLLLIIKISQTTHLCAH